MLKFNLAQLLADRNVSISSLSSKTGISRKTYSQLANNESKGIQLNTLEAITRELRCTVQDVIITGQDQAMIMFRLPEQAVPAAEGIPINCLTVSEADTANEAIVSSILDVTVSMTPNGNVLSYVYPVTQSVMEDIKYPDTNDKILAIVANASSEAAQAISASIMALAISQTGITPKKKGSCTVVWSHDGGTPVKALTLENKSISADQISAKSVLVDGLDITNGQQHRQ